MSRVLPILFNAEMVRAILDGRKTVTRRMIKPQPLDGHFSFVYHSRNIHIWTGGEIIKPPYQPGDILYVRETFVQAAAHTFWYKADNNEWLKNCKQWLPSIHMPKEAAHIWLKVTDVRVERLQEITSKQILQEGANPDAIHHYIKQMPEETEEWIEAAYKIEFQQIWNSTIKKSDLDCYGWDANPWVWVIEFERCEKPKEDK